jgi:hypothetical protein
VAEAHELDALLLVLHPLDERVDVTAVAVDLVEHLQNGLIGATVERAPQCVDATGNRREQVGLR